MQGRRNAMKHAVMIIAHKNVAQTIRLIRKFPIEHYYVFLHLDKKMKITPSEMIEIRQCANNLIICEKRISGRIDHWSLIEIPLMLMRLAKSTETQRNIHFDYYLLLSGQDYPIKSTETIAEYLAAVYPKPLIDCTPYDEHNWVFKKFNLVAFVNLNRKINARMKPGLLRKILKSPIHILARTLSFGKTTWNRFFMDYGYALYGGAAWWILPDQVIDFIIKEAQEYPAKTERLKHTLTPEETYFQIMTMASPSASLVEVNPIDRISQNCMTYSHFCDIGKPFVGHPYIFVKEDFAKLNELEHLFARKFDLSVDDRIFDLIDQKYG
jgi:hypothetical protein